MTTNDPVLIRRAEPRDVSTLGRLGASLVRTHHAFDQQRFLTPAPRLEDGYAHFLSTQLAEDDVAIFVAERAGTVVGYVYAGIEPRSWKELRDVAGFIHDVVVDADARRAGVATRLIERAAEWLVARGAPRVMLWTAEHNRDAQRLFEHLGFRRTMIEMTREARRL
jgi:ribosomal protein S18 acetylase RimI-like enzyme